MRSFFIVHLRCKVSMFFWKYLTFTSLRLILFLRRCCWKLRYAQGKTPEAFSEKKMQGAFCVVIFFAAFAQ
jgi:hypothetical protein